MGETITVLSLMKSKLTPPALPLQHPFATYNCYSRRWQNKVPFLRGKKKLQVSAIFLNKLIKETYKETYKNNPKPSEICNSSLPSHVKNTACK